MKIISVVGTRPNFMKMAPVYKAIKKFSKKNLHKKIEHLICHTGQHYDKSMSEVFLKDLELPKPDFYLGIGSGSHIEQIARIMIEFEKILMERKPDLVIVYGDVNSTAAGALAAAKLNIKIAHVEAGLRSFDRTMPEETNRILTDQISDFLFVTEDSGLKNLKKEGVIRNKIFFVGNTMIDSLVNCIPKTEKSNIIKKLKLIDDDSQILPYILLTLHRPSNVDDKNTLVKIFKLLNFIAQKIKIVFPVHPRTGRNFELWDIINSTKSVNGFFDNILLSDPVSYIDFLALMKNTKVVVTDSGGIQEETTYLRVPCLTLRKNTERPVTITQGTNQLTSLKLLPNMLEKTLNKRVKEYKIPELWDGKASNRIVEIISKNFKI